MPCVALPIGSDASLAGGLAALDCQINDAVALGYGKLLGPSGVFGAALTILLTLYVAFIGFGLITGRTRLTLPALSPKLTVFALVLTFATAWPAYQTLVYGLLTGGPDQIANALMGGRGGAAAAFAVRLDTLLNDLVATAQNLAAAGKAAKMAADLLWTSGLLLLLSTVGLLVVSRIVLAVLLALGPVFIIFALFRPTRGLFESWLKAAIGLALTPMLAVLGGAGVIAVLDPVMDAIAADPAAAAVELRPIVTLFLGSVVYAGLLAALACAAAALGRGWRLPLAREAPAASDHPPTERHTTVGGGVTPWSAAGQTHQDKGDRIATLVASIQREETRLGQTRVEVVAPPLSTAVARPADRRSEGLGQSFRQPAESAPRSGTYGS